MTHRLPCAANRVADKTSKAVSSPDRRLQAPDGLENSPSQVTDGLPSRCGSARGADGGTNQGVRQVCRRERGIIEIGMWCPGHDEMLHGHVKSRNADPAIYESPHGFTPLPCPAELWPLISPSQISRTNRLKLGSHMPGPIGSPPRPTRMKLLVSSSNLVALCSARRGRALSSDPGNLVRGRRCRTGAEATVNCH